MNYVVLVKQVPDIRNIPKEAWDWEKGTLKRGLLDNVLNELDKQALAFALKIKESQGGRVIAVTMGPPFAEEVLRYALSVGADDALLLTDRKLGGADTAATAYPLGQAIRKIEKEIFGGRKDHLIISGMQSVDGDTAQVPPQIAEELGIAHIAYATSFAFENGRLQISRITRSGSETVAPQSFPCLVTVAEWTKPFYPSFSRTRWARSYQIYQWSAADINAAESRIGLAGSRTNVVKIFSPREAGQRTCVFERDMRKLADMVKEAYSNRAKVVEEEEKPKYQLLEGKKPDYQGEVWIYAEQEGGELNQASFELLGKACQLASVLGEKVGSILVGKEINNLSQKLITYGADKVYIAEHELLENFLPVPYTKVISDMIEKHRPQMVLFSATPLGRELAPRVAYRSDSGLTADCTGLDIADFSRAGKEHIGILVQTRPALGGNIMASIVSQNSKAQMSTARPGVMKAREPDLARKGEIISYVPNITEADLGVRIIFAEHHPLASDIKDAEIIVCGGRALKTKEGFDRYIFSLADRIGKFLGQEVMVGASRLAVEVGCIGRGHQVGQTGQMVKPRLYIAIGVSGAVQHVTGMQRSDIVVAINKDPNARIFRVADFGVVGNLEEIVPELINALDSQRGNNG
ncbi:MAG: FAD-binding protein [Chloroflexota bacterium]